MFITVWNKVVIFCCRSFPTSGLESQVQSYAQVESICICTHPELVTLHQYDATYFPVNNNPPYTLIYFVHVPGAQLQSSIENIHILPGSGALINTSTNKTVNVSNAHRTHILKCGGEKHRKYLLDAQSTALPTHDLNRWLPFDLHFFCGDMLMTQVKICSLLSSSSLI